MDDPTEWTTGVSAAPPPKSLLEWAGEADLAHQWPEILSVVANEIHFPMESILETVGHLLETELTGEQLILAEKIQRSGNVLLTTINNLVDFSKIESGELRLQAIDFDLRATLAEVNRELGESGGGSAP